MTSPVQRIVCSMKILLVASLVFTSGCDDESVRGAGSIDIPKESLKRYDYSKPTPARRDKPTRNH